VRDNCTKHRDASTESQPCILETSFSWDDYKNFCTHKVTDAERGVLEAMVSGGRPVWNTSASLAPGYLKKSNDRYEVTEQFIDALPAKVNVVALAS
jgi:hypothetical protein